MCLRNLCNDITFNPTLVKLVNNILMESPSSNVAIVPWQHHGEILTSLEWRSIRNQPHWSWALIISKLELKTHVLFIYGLIDYTFKTVYHYFRIYNTKCNTTIKYVRNKAVLTLNHAEFPKCNNPPYIFGTVHYHFRDIEIRAQQYRAWSAVRMCMLT